jgi:hypothetical protein
MSVGQLGARKAEVAQGVVDHLFPRRIERRCARRIGKRA